MKIEEVLQIIREELIRQSKRHGNSALARVAEYKGQKKTEIIIRALKLLFTAEALENFSHALTPERFAEWMKDSGECENH